MYCRTQFKKTAEPRRPNIGDFNRSAGIASLIHAPSPQTRLKRQAGGLVNGQE